MGECCPAAPIRHPSQSVALLTILLLATPYQFQRRQFVSLEWPAGGVIVYCPDSVFSEDNHNPVYRFFPYRSGLPCHISSIAESLQTNFQDGVEYYVPDSKSWNRRCVLRQVCMHGACGCHRHERQVGYCPFGTGRRACMLAARQVDASSEHHWSAAPFHSCCRDASRSSSRHSSSRSFLWTWGPPPGSRFCMSMAAAPGT